MPIKRLFSALRGTRSWHLPEGRRVYAVGDIHGRLDLLDRLLDSIAEDEAARPPADTTIIFLGDLVDRGPDSCGVVERLLQLSRGPMPTRFLRGNHDDVFLRAIDGDVRALRFLIRIGGRSTVLSYGISEEDYRQLGFEELAEVLREKVPDEHRAFLASFEPFVEIGDYLFVHAGVKPGVPIEDQSTSDLYWIRDDFLQCRDCFGKMVVHGHSISEGVEVRSNRIGIDTGAFATGQLTAVGLEQSRRWFLST